MKKYIMLTITILLAIIVATSFICETQAVGLNSIDPEGARNPAEAGNTGELVNIGNIIVKVIRTFGEALSVVILAVVGIRYIMGSVEEKAEYKQTLWIYIVAAALIFGGSTLAQIIYEMFQ